MIKGLREENAELRAANKRLEAKIDKLLDAKFGKSSPSSSDQKEEVHDEGRDQENYEGFVTVEKKKKKEGKHSDKVHNDQKAEDVPFPHPVLIKEDWPVPIIETSEFCDGGSGIALTTQSEGERIAKDMIQCTGKLAILTPKAIPNSNSREMKVKVKLANGRIDYRDKFFTCLGDKEFKPTFEKSNVISECTLKMTNRTKRIVLQLQERYADEKLFDLGLQNPYLPFDGWLKESNLSTEICFTSRPFLKEIGESRWFEMVATIRESAFVKFLQNSGLRGIFVNPFRERGEQSEYAVVWLEDNISLNDAVNRARVHGANVRGVVSSKRGLGIRVQSESFKDMVGKLLPPEMVEKELRRQGQKVYEVSKAPPWLDVEDLVTILRKEWKWDVDYLRTVRAWNTKTILLRSADPPKRDTIIVGYHKMTVQPAREREQTKPVSRTMDRKENSVNMNRDKGSTPSYFSKTKPQERPHTNTSTEHNEVMIKVMDCIKDLQGKMAAMTDWQERMERQEPKRVRSFRKKKVSDAQSAMAIENTEVSEITSLSSGPEEPKKKTVRKD